MNVQKHQKGPKNNYKTEKDAQWDITHYEN